MCKGFYDNTRYLPPPRNYMYTYIYIIYHIILRADPAPESLFRRIVVAVVRCTFGGSMRFDLTQSLALSLYIIRK